MYDTMAFCAKIHVIFSAILFDFRKS